MFTRLAAIAIACSIALPASAASDEAWAEFAREVEEGCIAASSALLTDSSVTVDPFGSESYGLAAVTGTAADGATKSVICVFDKQSKAVEIGGELDFSARPVAAP